jgi:hypothetical protein
LNSAQDLDAEGVRLYLGQLQAGFLAPAAGPVAAAAQALKAADDEDEEESGDDAEGGDDEDEVAEADAPEDAARR